MFIKLTAWKSDSKDGEPIYLNPLTITSIKADASITHVGTVDGVWFVMETPEEIMKAIEGKVIIHAMETECKEVKV